VWSGKNEVGTSKCSTALTVSASPRPASQRVYGYYGDGLVHRLGHVAHDDRRHVAHSIPDHFVSVCASKLNISIHLLSSFHSLLCLIAGLFIVGDRVFWISNRAEVGTLHEETRLSILKTAFDAYLRDDEKAVMQVIKETFPSEPPGQRNLDMEKRLVLLIRTHCLTSPTRMQTDSV